MIEYDEQQRKLVLKLVYYGPALSGKTTNLLCLHDLLSNEGRGELMVLDTVDDRTIYFDLLPFFYVSPSGFRIKLKVFTVPGQVRHDATRKAVLQRADGIVFVADSQRGEMANNAESFANLERNLSFVGLALGKLPLVIQFNKRDLDAIITPEEISGTWGPTGLPVVLASALRGDGIVETYERVVSLIYDVLDGRLGLTARFGVEKAGFIRSVARRQ